MTSPDSILYLTGIWYDLIRKEHHKDRDCHFAVVKRWSYGNRPTYHIEHRKGRRKCFVLHAQADDFQ